MNEAAAFQQQVMTEDFGSVGRVESLPDANRNILTKRSAVALLEKLSTDSAFRVTYMANPREVLRGIGVSENELPDRMPALEKLADMAVFEAALTEVRQELASVHSCQNPPTVRFNVNA